MFFEDKFTLYVDNGKKIEYDILFTHTDEKTGTEYIVYTEKDSNENEEICVYSAILKINEQGEQILESIKTEQEQQMIDNLIDEFFDSLDSFFEDEK